MCDSGEILEDKTRWLSLSRVRRLNVPCYLNQTKLQLNPTHFHFSLSSINQINVKIRCSYFLIVKFFLTLPPHKRQYPEYASPGNK